MVSRLAGVLVLAELRGLTFRKEVGNRGGSSNKPSTGHLCQLLQGVHPPDTSVFLLSVGRRAKLEMDTANHVGLLVMPPPHRRFSAQTSTQISIHSPGAGSITDRGERRVRKNEKRQSGSDCLAPQAFVTFAPERGQKELLLRGERGQKEKVRCINRSESANRSMSHSLWAQ